MGCTSSKETSEAIEHEKYKKAEADKVSKAAHKPNSKMTKTVNKIADTIWEKYDKDNNGKLDYSELKPMMRETFERIQLDGENREGIDCPSEEQMEKAFKEYDRDGNGWIEKEEMKRYIRKQMGCPDCQDD